MQNKKNIHKSYKEFLYSPFRYNGHQAYALGSILSIIPEHTSFVEPFCGGAGVFFAKRKADYTQLNDINNELIETYKVMRGTPDELFKFFSGDYSNERYNYIRDEFIPSNRLEIAARWFYLNRNSDFSLMAKRWERDPEIVVNLENLKSLVLRCSEKLQDVNLTCGDFEKIINLAQEGSFLFMSPPYSFGSSPKRISQYLYPFEEEDHLRLSDTLKRNSRRIKFLLTYRDSVKVRDIYSWNESGIEPLVSDYKFIGDPTKRHNEEIKRDENQKEIIIRNFGLDK